MGSFRCYDSSNVIATLMMTNFHLNTTDVAIFPNVCLWRRSLCSDLTLKNCIEPPSYARTAYVVAIWPSFLFDSFVKIWATCEVFLANGLPPPHGKKFPVRLCFWFSESSDEKNFMPKNFLEINRYFALTSYCDAIDQSNNAFSILGFSLAGKRRVHVLIFSSIGR